MKFNCREHNKKTHISLSKLTKTIKYIKTNVKGWIYCVFGLCSQTY